MSAYLQDSAYLRNYFYSCRDREKYIQGLSDLFLGKKLKLKDNTLSASCSLNFSQAAGLWSDVFPEDKDSMDVIRQHLSGASIYGIICGDKTVSMASVLPVNIHINKHKYVKCGFIIGVASDRSWRSLDLSRTILNKIKADMSEHQFKALYLATFIPDFYKRFNFNTVGRRIVYKCGHNSDLLKENSCSARFFTGGDFESVLECYKKNIQTGCISRDAAYMKWKISCCRQCVCVFDENKQLVGYALEAEDKFFDEIIGENSEEIMQAVNRLYKEDCRFSLSCSSLDLKDESFLSGSCFSAWTHQMIFSHEKIFDADFCCFDDW